MRFSNSMRRASQLACALVTCALLAGSAQAETDSTPTAKDAEFARFVEKSLASKATPPAAPAPAEGAASCEATEEGARNYATIKRLEADIERLRAAQAAKWKEKGWTAKEAAAAGESVVLNGSGYNIKNAAGPAGHGN